MRPLQGEDRMERGRSAQLRLEHLWETLTENSAVEWLERLGQAEPEADADDDDEDGIWPRENTRRLIDVLSDGNRLAAALQASSEIERFALWQVFSTMDLRFVTSTEEICRRVDAFAGERGAGRRVLSGLFQKGLVYCCQDFNGKSATMPAEAIGAYLPAAGPELLTGRWTPGAGPLEFCDGLDGSPVFEAGEKWLADLFTFLAFARQRGLRLRQDGEIYKKDQEALVELMSAKWQFDADPFLDLHLWHLLEYALSVGIAAETGRRRVRPTELAGRWARLPLERIYRSIAYHLARSAPRHPEGACLTKLAVFAHLPEQEARRWIDLDSAIRLFGHESGELKEPFVQGVQDALFRLALVGAAQVKRIGNGPNAAFRLTEWGRALLRGEEASAPLLPRERHFYVESTGDVVAAANTDLDVLWRLSAVAELKRVDQTLRFTLTKERLQAALDEGTPPSEILSFLEERSRGGLPQNVRFFVEETMEQHGWARIVRAALLECASAERAEALLAHPLVRACLIRRLDERTLMVDERFIRPLQDALAREGYSGVQRVFVKQAPEEGLTPELREWLERPRLFWRAEADSEAEQGPAPGDWEAAHAGRWLWEPDEFDGPPRLDEAAAPSMRERQAWIDLDVLFLDEEAVNEA